MCTVVVIASTFLTSRPLLVTVIFSEPVAVSVPVPTSVTLSSAVIVAFPIPFSITLPFAVMVSVSASITVAVAVTITISVTVVVTGSLTALTTAVRSAVFLCLSPIPTPAPRPVPASLAPVLSVASRRSARRCTPSPVSSRISVRRARTIPLLHRASSRVRPCFVSLTLRCRCGWHSIHGIARMSPLGLHLCLHVWRHKPVLLHHHWQHLMVGVHVETCSRGEERRPKWHTSPLRKTHLGHGFRWKRKTRAKHGEARSARPG
mmetsp:Transcript_8762/g.26341  ORF Transcript_8762/g.26341 Transcript_8762/m.26341 type:complete len:262 (+) Transcript_8762:947-1732(+)